MEIKIFTTNPEYGLWLSDNLVDSIEEADLVVFTGGSDVDPALYDEKPHFTTSYDTGRDLREMRLFNECKNNNIPMLGICRGSQFLTIMNSGKLIQNVENHALWGHHNITFKDGEICWITSTHHQMMYPFNLPKEDYDIIAWSTNRRSDVYETGFGQYMAEDIHVEPEIVHYLKTKCLAIQGHPEYMEPDSQAVIKIKELIKDLLL